MFELDARLNNDTVFITDLPLCRVLLMNDSQFPWVILVPRVAGATEFTDLDEKQMTQYTFESLLCSEILSVLYKPDKMNIAALGNIVKQLHIHHVVRFDCDVAWPAPVWGRQPAVPYEPAILDEHVSRLKQAFSTKEKI
ncbi:HIT domain-containing protein [Aestuariibacter sp. A3R04]|uniref:HIT domain-containing protein n=1 Tax=Aestuariibacter sp. A3R04 TaxID=2841571 RepID=UPI001C07F866|nr:HIT domain-containing protein [Aestuariibacter sp. A3R04]MBU3022603.1 HIT domain-containing protein [Aestuariibacter sp. A3R04]